MALRCIPQTRPANGTPHRGFTEKTPWLYRFKVSHPIVRTTATGEVPESLTEDILWKY